MANVSKIKLPDNTTRDIIDSRISSVDSSLSASSNGVVINSAITSEFAKVMYLGDASGSATYVDGDTVINVSTKADKVSNATNGNFASLNSSGNLVDSGHKHSDYQAALVSGTNIKTINNESLLGSGNITISGGGGGTGTVTSVAMTVPTGLSVSGSPITSSGTIAVSLATGYTIPTTNDMNGKEVTTNKVTSLSSSSTDTQYPSAKCVYDLLGDVENLINAL